MLRRNLKMLSLYEARISMSDSAIYHSARRVVDNVIVARSGAFVKEEYIFTKRDLYR